MKSPPPSFKKQRNFRMAQDPVQCQPAFLCSWLALFEDNPGKSGSYTGVLCGLFAKRSFSPKTKGLAQNRRCDLLKTRFIAGPNRLRLTLLNKKHCVSYLHIPPVIHPDEKRRPISNDLPQRSQRPSEHLKELAKTISWMVVPNLLTSSNWV